MVAAESRPNGIISPTFDFLFSFFGLSVVIYPIVSSVAGVAIVPNYITVQVTGILAFVGTYPFVTERLSLDMLTDYVFVYLITIVLIGILGGIIIILFKFNIRGSSEIPQLLLFTAAHIVTVAFLKRNHSAGLI